MNYRSKYTSAEIEAALDKIINNVTDNDELATIIGNVNKRFDNYLPLTGGTINSGSGQVSLMLSSTGATTRIAFLKGETLLGYFAFAGVDTPQYITAAGREYDLFHEGNYVDLIGNTYLKTTGGTLTGNLTVPLLVLNGGMYLDTSGAKDLIVYDNTARRIVLHSGNYSDYALPLSGGTMSGRLETTGRISLKGSILELNASDGTTGVYLQCVKTMLGENEMNLSIYDGSSWHKAIHSGNYASYALPVSGGTITGNTWNPLNIKSSNIDSAAITLAPSSGNGLQLGWTNTQGAFLYNYQNLCQIGVHPDGYAYFKTYTNLYTLLHSGNYADQIGDYYLKTSGGTIEGTGVQSLLIKSGNESSSAIKFITSDNSSITFGYKKGSGLFCTNENGWSQEYTLLTSAGGTIEGNLTIRRSPSVIFFETADGSPRGSLGIVSAGPVYYDAASVGYDLLHEGNYSDYALPLSGGTIEGALTIKHTASAALSLNTVASTTRIAFFNNDTLWGFLAFDALDKPTFITSGGGRRELFHEGNYSNLIGNTYLKTDGSNKMKDVMILEFANPRIAFKSDADTTLGSIGFYNGVPSVYLFEQTAWKTIAFTDSTVNKAKMLVNDSDVVYANFESQGYVRIGLPNTYNSTRVDGYSILFTTNNPSSNAMLINSSGNVTLGASDLAETDAKLAVNGRIAIFGSGNTEYPALLLSTAEYGLQIVAGLDENNQKLPIAFGWRNSLDIPMLINASGNVTIGDQDYAGTGTKLHVEGLAYTYSLAATRSVSLNRNPNNGTIYDSATLALAIESSGDAITFGAYRGDSSKIGVPLALSKSGNVGIGTTDPQEKLEVAGNVASTSASNTNRYVLAKNSMRSISLYAGTNVVGLYSGTVSKWMAFMDDESNVRIPNPTYIEGNLHVTGNIIADGEVSAGENTTALLQKITELEQRLVALGG